MFFLSRRLMAWCGITTHYIITYCCEFWYELDRFQCILAHCYWRCGEVFLRSRTFRLFLCICDLNATERKTNSSRYLDPAWKKVDIQVECKLGSWEILRPPFTPWTICANVPFSTCALMSRSRRADTILPLQSKLPLLPISKFWDI